MRKNKFAAILVLCVFLFGITATGAVAKKANPEVNLKVNNDGSVQVTFNFKDMHEAAWAIRHMYKMKAENIIKGYEDGTFRPNKPVTHAEAVVLTMRAAGLQDEVDNYVVNAVYLPFKDANSIPDWALKAVALAAEKGYLESDTSGNFQANKAASREWAVKLVAKTMGLQPMDMELPFKDADKISADTAGYVAAAVYNHLISGFPNGNFLPNKPLTRAEMAVMLGLAEEEFPVPGKIKNKIEGIVTAVSVDAQVYSNVYTQGTITLSGSTYPVAGNARIFINDQPAALADIAIGSEAEVVVDGKGMVVYIEVDPVTVNGVVDAVYASDRKLYIFEKDDFEKNRNRNRDKGNIPERERERNRNMMSESIMYNVDNSAVIVLNGAPATLADLLRGDVAKLTLKADGIVTHIKAWRFHKKIKIEDEDEDEDEGKDEIEGRVSAVNSGRITIVDEDGNTVEYGIAANAVIRIEGRPGTVAQIKTGDKAELKIKNNLVVKLVIESSDEDEDEDKED